MIAIGVGQIRGCWTKHFKIKIWWIRSFGGLLKAQPTPWNLESHLHVLGSDYVQGRPEKVLIFPPLTSREILHEKRMKAKVGLWSACEDTASKSWNAQRTPWGSYWEPTGWETRWLKKVKDMYLQSLAVHQANGAKTSVAIHNQEYRLYN